jgi:hypothetical protein
VIEVAGMNFVVAVVLVVVKILAWIEIVFFFL